MTTDDPTRPSASRGRGTRVIHAGRKPGEAHGFVNTPVYHGSTVLFPTVADLQGGRARYTYARKGTPTMSALEEALRDLEGGAGVVLCPSGAAAVSTALLSCLRAGDHLLVTDSVYRPTRTLCDGLLARLGITTTYYDPRIGAGIDALIRPETRAVLVEAPGSQSFEVQDVPAIAGAAHARGARVLMDNTWATPLYFDAHGHGVDLAIGAGTKYLGGHSDIMFGTVSANAAAWPDLRRTWEELGVCVGPDDVFLALRGLRTLPLRLREHERAGLAVARWLEARPEVLRVLHPALPSHPDHALWRRDFTGASSLFAVVLHPVPDAAVAAMLDGLALFGMGYSWGGFESLAIPFDCGSYRTATTWNPGGPTLRLHIGLEDVDDLLADLDAGFARLRAAAAVAL